MWNFFVGDAIHATNILDIHRYIMKEAWYKMFEFIKKCLFDY